MKKRNGSAIMMVLVILTILLITSTYLMQNKTKRAGFTRYMSNEKKVEAVAEAVLDMTLANIKAKANKHDEVNDLYTMLRAIGTSPTGNHSSGSKNAILSVSDTSVPLGPSSEYFQLAFDSITQGDSGVFDQPKVSAKIIHAEAFGDANDDYRIVGVNLESTKATGKGANNFPNDPANPNQDWRVPLQYPPHSEDGDYTDIWNIPGLPGIAHNGFAYQSPKLKVNLKYKDVPGWALALAGVKDSVSINLLLNPASSDIGSKSAFEFGVHLDEKFLKRVNKLLDLLGIDEITDEVITEGLTSYMGDSAIMDVEKLILENVETFKDLGNALSTNSLQKVVMNGDNSSTYQPSASNRPAPNNDIIEKGAILQLTCETAYLPNGSSKKLEKTFVAEIPFKLSDVQPIAPEYTFFVANSGLLGDPGTGSVGEIIDFTRSDDGGIALGIDNEFYLHNMHHKGITEDPTHNLTYQTAGGRDPKAGKIRVNGEAKPIPLFMGTLDGIEASELGALALTDSPDDKARKLQLKVTFGWFKVMNNISKLTDSVKLYLPVLTNNQEYTFKPSIVSGIDGIYQVYKENGFDDIFTMPTLFYGHGHMDYPLGNKIEGKVPGRVAEVYVVAQVHNKLTFDVRVFSSNKVKPSSDPWHKPIKTYYGYKNIENYPTTGRPIPYGLPNIQSFDSLEESFVNVDYAGMPENCYSDTQYRKKASRFYQSPADFISDCNLDIKKGGLEDDGNIRIDGVIYVDGGQLILNEIDKNITFIGNGLIVANNIKMEGGSVMLADTDSSLGLIARTGILELENTKVAASCFSNGPPVITKTTIYGNLIVNAFDRQTVYHTDVRYTPDNILVKGNSFNERADKSNPRRYYASFADNWSKSYFEKK